MLILTEPILNLAVYIYILQIECNKQEPFELNVFLFRKILDIQQFFTLLIRAM